MSFNPGEVILGKFPHKHDDRTLKLESYLVPTELPIAPQILDYGKFVDNWPMYGNDRLGDCTIAAAGHMIELWTGLVGKVFSVSEKTIEKDYFQVTDGQDTGAYELDVLNFWRKNGITKVAHHILAFTQVDHSNQSLVKLATYLFGGSYLGIGLPISAQNQTGPGKVWDVPYTGVDGDGKPWSWGGHAVNVVGYDDNTISVVTWGFIQKMTWAFFNTYVDECWALIPKEWNKKTGISGINIAQLTEDLKQFGKVVNTKKSD